MNKFCLLINSGKDIYTMGYDPPSSIVNHRVKINCPVRSTSGIHVFGYCNGLFCISSLGMKLLFLWNPTTQEYKKLPIPQLRHPRSYTCDIGYGFGYDDKIHDFKVVFIASFKHISRIEVHIYTLRCDIWRCIGEFPYDLSKCSRMSDIARVPVNGVLYWIALTDYDGNSDSIAIIYFDFEKETFEKMPLPKFAVPDFLDDHTWDYNKFVRRLCVLEGSLCLLCSNREAFIDLWQLDNKTRNSWTKLFTVDQKKLFGFKIVDWMPLRSFENCWILLGSEKKDASFHMILYDPKDESSKPLGEFQFASECLLRTSVYVESLVSLNAGTYLWQGHVEYYKEEEGHYLDYYEEEEDDDDNYYYYDSDEEEDEYDFGKENIGDDLDTDEEEDEYDFGEENIDDDLEEEEKEDGGGNDDDEAEAQEDTEKKKRKREENGEAVLDDIRKMFTTLKKPKMKYPSFKSP